VRHKHLQELVTIRPSVACVIALLTHAAGEQIPEALLVFFLGFDLPVQRGFGDIKLLANLRNAVFLI
jgi:hypothetical protein